MALPLPGPLGCFRIRSVVSGAGLRGRGGGGGSIAERRRRVPSGCGVWVPPLSGAVRRRSWVSSLPGRPDGCGLRQSSLVLASLPRLQTSLPPGTQGLSPGGRSAASPSLRSAALPPQPGSRYSEALPSPPSTSAPAGQGWVSVLKPGSVSGRGAKPACLHPPFPVGFLQIPFTNPRAVNLFSSAWV